MAFLQRMNHRNVMARHHLLFALLAISSVFCLSASASLATPQQNNYFVFPLDSRQSAPLVRRGRRLVEASGKVDIDGSVRVGYFYAVLPLGTPPKAFDVIVDTGSTVTYVPCHDCEHCGAHNGDPFNPAESPTSKWVDCDDQQCKQLDTYDCDLVKFPGQCVYSIAYAEQSTSQGRLVQDVFTFPDSQTRVPITFGCENDETGEIFRQKPDGIVGMGNSPGAFHSQLAAAGAIPHTFSLCFGFPTGGALLLGDAPVPSNPTFSWTSFTKSGWGDFFVIDMTEITYGDKPLKIPEYTFSTGYRTVLDSGTTFIYLTTAAYLQFAAATSAAAAAAGLRETSDSYEDICWHGAAPDFADLDRHFPTASFKFAGGAELSLPPYRYMFQLSQKGTYCMAVFDNGNAGSLIGGVATRNVLVKYDLQKQRVGFADVDCQALGKLPAKQFVTHNESSTAAAAAKPAAAAAAKLPAGVRVAPAAAAAAAAANPKQQPAVAAVDTGSVMPVAVTNKVTVIPVEKTDAILHSSSSSSDGQKVASQQDGPILSSATAAAAAAKAAAPANREVSAAPAAAAAAAEKQTHASAVSPAAAAAAAAESGLSGGNSSSSSSSSAMPTTTAAVAEDLLEPTPALAGSSSSSSSNDTEVATTAADSSSTAAVQTDLQTDSTAAAGSSSSSSDEISNPSMPSTTAAVSEDLLEPSLPAAAAASNGSSTNGTNTTAAGEAGGEGAGPAKVYWGTGSGTTGIGGEDHGSSSGSSGMSAAVVLILAVLLGAVLLAAAAAVAYIVRRRQIKAAGFSQLSATEVDCELAGYNRNNNQDDDPSNGYNTSANGYGGVGNNLGGFGDHPKGSPVAAAAAQAGAQNGVSSSSTISSMLKVPESSSRDAVKSPAGGRDQQSPMDTAAAAAAAAAGDANSKQGLLLRLPNASLQQQQQQQRQQSQTQQQQQQQHVAVFSLDQDEAETQQQQQQQHLQGTAADAAAAGSGSNGMIASTSVLPAGSLDIVSLE